MSDYQAPLDDMLLNITELVDFEEICAMPCYAHVTLTGDMAGNFLVFDSRNGALLRKVATGGALAGGVITYELAANNTLLSPPATSRVRSVNVEDAARLRVHRRLDQSNSPTDAQTLPWRTQCTRRR